MKSEPNRVPVASVHDALILVDLQNDFLPGGALAVRHADQVIPIANRLQPSFDLVVATRDWHPPQHGSFAASHSGSQTGELIQLDGLPQVLWPVHCVQHSEGAELAVNLDPIPTRREVFKGQHTEIDSYSGFFDNGHRQHTKLHALLSRHGVQRVFIMGLATDYCVKFTALDAVELGYETVLVLDGCRGVDRQGGDIDRAVQAMRDAGVKILLSDQVQQLVTEYRNESPTRSLPLEVLAETAHVRLLRRGNWDYVTRNTGSGVVAIVAKTDSEEMILIEQYRPPLGRNVIELPAGIAGDLDTALDESLEDAASRELFEEAGYRADRLRSVLTAASSAGITDERITFVMATGLVRVDEGGGDASESITVHHVPLCQIDDWLRRQADSGTIIDSRVPAGLYLLREGW